MTENFLTRAAADGKVVFATLNLWTKIARLKMDIRKKRSEKERCLKSIGVTIYGLHSKDRDLSSQDIWGETRADIETIIKLEAEIVEAEAEIKTTQAEFRTKLQPKGPQGQGPQGQEPNQPKS